MLGVLPGCIKYHKTLPTEFPQGQAKPDYRDITANYVKSARVYDQFTTRALFDTLWLSDDVRVAYGKLHCSKRGTAAEDTEAFIDRQREENKHWMMFYVLADVRDRQGTSLSDKNAPWTFYLKVGDYTTAPLSIKEVDLEPEYQQFFGKQFNLFKTAYAIKFPARDVTEKHKVKPTDAVNLVIEAVDKSVTLTWPIVGAFKGAVSEKRVVKDEDFYWG
jgi:hypothetical protein